jgi:hypothetical protein
MIQALDLARENAALKDEVERLRKSLGQLVEANGSDDDETPGSLSAPRPLELTLRHSARVSRADLLTAARLMLVMPRHLALDYGLSVGHVGGPLHCSVIVDRRVTERRRGPVDYRGRERRRRDRRSDQLDAPAALVVSLR